ncbi:MAG TPA: hypothetical protein VF290_26325 [Pyrinomonadaceae bacterium]
MRQSSAWLLTIVLLTLSACTSTTKRVAVEQAPAYQPTPESTPVRLAAAAAPKLPEVQDAIKRVFKDAAVLDTNRKPNFLMGDFNGDTSQDIAVIIKPVNLEEMNQEFSPWLVRSPLANKLDRAQLKIEKDEPLLAVIHGYGTNDWRDPEATQTFVLKHVVGDDLKVHSGKEFVASNAGRKLPRTQGDLIGETVQGTQGYLYYAVSTYAWYDPKSYKDSQDAPGVFHKSRPMR